MTRQLHLTETSAHRQPLQAPFPKQGVSSNPHYSRTNSRHISRRILSPEDRPTTDPTNAPKPHKKCATQRPLPLSSHIVRLIRQCGRNVSVRACCDEKDAEVAGAAVGCKTHDGQTDEGEEGIGDQDRAANVVAVAEKGGEEHEEDSEDVLREKKGG